MGAVGAVEAVRMGTAGKAGTVAFASSTWSITPVGGTAARSPKERTQKVQKTHWRKRRAANLRASNDSDEKKPRFPPVSRRSVIQAANGVLGVATLGLLVRMKEQFRLLSLSSILSALGLRKAPSAVALSEIDESAVQRFLERAESRQIRAPDFPKRANWVNTKPLSLNGELKNKLVLLDFWTYCCINCMHILPLLSEMEKEYGDSSGFAVVGVHSAKFTAERDDDNVRQAVARYEVNHPVINDGEMELWGKLGVTGWPTLALLSPRGNIISMWSGEGNDQDVKSVVAGAMKFYETELDRRPLPPTVLPKSRQADNGLRYPGKLCLSEDSGTLYVADSGNNRVVEIELESGRCIRSFGNGQPDFVDGQATECAFHRPQGLAVDRGTLYVCDTENHAIRMVNLQEGSVTTIAGDGVQGFDYRGGLSGANQRLSSPWDIALSKKDGIGYVAMAGTHQIWSFPLHSENSGGRRIELFSGSGREQEKNARLALRASWAQPSGLSLDSRGDIFVADSESSSIRRIDMNTTGNPTETIAGGDGLMADNLFAFGDSDGRRNRARFQHPLGLVAVSDSKLLVADSYNHKIKVVDSVTGRAKSFVGEGKAGLTDGRGRAAQFWEPSGLAMDNSGDYLLVADTNNHAIRKVDISSGLVTTLDISGAAVQQMSDKKQKLVKNRRRAVVVDDERSIGPGSSIVLSLALGPGLHITEGTVPQYQVSDSSGNLLLEGTLRVDQEVSLSLSSSQEVSGEVEVEALVYFCGSDDVCRVRSFVFRHPATTTQPPGRPDISHRITV